MKRFYEKTFDAFTRFATTTGATGLDFGKPYRTSLSGLSGTSLFLSSEKPIMGFREDAINFSDLYFTEDDRFFVFSGHGSNPQFPSEILKVLRDEDGDICGAVREGCKCGEELKSPWWCDFTSVECPDIFYALDIQWALLRHWTDRFREGFPTRHGVAIDVSAVFTALRENGGVKLPFFLLRPGIAAMPPYGNHFGSLISDDGDFEIIPDWDVWDDIRSGELPPCIRPPYHKIIKIGCKTVNLYWEKAEVDGCDFPIDGKWYPLADKYRSYQPTIKAAFARHGINVEFAKDEVKLCRQ